MTSGESHDEPERVDLNKSDGSTPTRPQSPADEPFDPYRFGKPETPPPPEYAPPGYVPDPPSYSAPPTQAGGAPGYPTAPPGYPTGQYPPSPYNPPSAHGQQPPGTYPGFAVPQGNGKAVAGMVLGILSIVFCWTTLFDLVLLVPAVVFSALGLGTAKLNGRGRGQAITGLICAAIGVVLAVVVLIFAVHIVGQCSGIDHDSGAYNRCVRNHI